MHSVEGGVISSLTELEKQVATSMSVLAASREIFIEQTMVLALRLPEKENDKAKRLLRPELANLLAAVDGVSSTRIQPLLYKAASDFLG